MTMHNPPHPGRAIKEEFDYLGLPIAKAAEALGVTRQQLYRVTKGESNISPEMALRLEAVIGSTADTWLRLQTAYDLAQLRQHAKKITRGLKKIEPPVMPRPEQGSQI